MDAYADFSVNKTAFPDLKNFTNKLHDNNQRMIVIVDAGISADNVDNKYYVAA
jgi:alpha-glucosidase (family GH31 glycosyl hydrolase)